MADQLTDASAALSQLFAVVSLLGDAMERDLELRGLTRARATVVWELSRNGPMTNGALADALRVSPRNVTGLVDALERSQMVSRGPHPTDRRATMVNLTPRGSKAARAMRADHERLAAFLFDGLSPAEVTAFAATLGELGGRLRDAEFDSLRERALERWPARSRP